MNGKTQDGAQALLTEMRASLSSTRQAIRSVLDKGDLSLSDGISLLTLKAETLLSYVHALSLLIAHRVMRPSSLAEHSPPALPFSAADRPARGTQAGDLVDASIEGRIVLEKIRAMDGRMRYQIEKLVRLAQDESADKSDVVNDLLAFRPNPQNMMSAYDGDIADSDEQREKDEETTAEGIYRPPKLAPMPYTAAPSRKSERRPQADPSALTALLNADPTRPHLESSTGLGTTPSLSSSRAKAVQRYTEYEEENFTRLVMKKQDMKRRAREEEELLLGGSLGGRSRRGGGFEGEFADVLKDVGASKKISGGDPYEELRRKGRKADLMTRSRVRSRDEALQDFEEVSRPDKKTRFEKQTKAVRRKLAKVKK